MDLWAKGIKVRRVKSAYEKAVSRPSRCSCKLRVTSREKRVGNAIAKLTGKLKRKSKNGWLVLVRGRELLATRRGGDS